MCSVIAVSRYTLPAADAAKARKIVAQGWVAHLVGDARQLRRIAAVLRDDPDVRTFLGDDGDGSTHLVVEGGPEDVGALAADHVSGPRPA
jgi:hypothetical protein